jgi:hypothetical protein
MKKLLLIFGLFYASISLFSQEQTIKTKIEKVKVFLSGAQISRSAKVNIAAGKSTIVFDDIPVNVNEESILVNSTGDFMMLSVLNQIESNPVGVGSAEELTLLNRQLKQYNDSIAFEKSRLEIYKSQLSLLARLDNKFDPQDSFSLNDIKDAIEFQNVKLSDIKTSEIKSNDKILFYNSKIQELNMKISNLPQKITVQKRKVVVDLSSEAPTLGNFTISYYTGSAQWSSSYDIRVKDINNPVELHHKADIIQYTGENWDNVMISLSNGNPAESAIKPNLLANYIEYTAPVEVLKLYGIKEDKTISGTVTDKNDGQPLPGVNVQIQGTSIGAITDLNGKFTILAPKGSTAILFSFVGYKNKLSPINNQIVNIQLEYNNQQLDEVVVVGYGVQKKQVVGATTSVPVNTVINQTSVEFDIDFPYNIPSDNRKHSVMIRELSFPASYQYYCVPKLNKEAFLIAKITNWENSDLSEGSANLYFEGTYLGKSQLNLKGVKDTLLLSLGRDKNIKIERTTLKDNSSKQLIGNKKTDEKGYQISIKNLKKQPVNLLVEDQLPLSTLEEILITPLELNNGEFDQNTGSIKWPIRIESQKEKTIVFRYSIKYPKGFQISEGK